MINSLVDSLTRRSIMDTLRNLEYSIVPLGALVDDDFGTLPTLTHTSMKDNILTIDMKVVGYDKDSLVVSVDPETRVLSVVNKEGANTKWYHRKINYEIVLPDVYNLESASAKCDNGVLTVSFEKTENKKKGKTSVKIQ